MNKVEIKLNNDVAKSNFLGEVLEAFIAQRLTVKEENAAYTIYEIYDVGKITKEHVLDILTNGGEVFGKHFYVIDNELGTIELKNGNKVLGIHNDYSRLVDYDEVLEAEFVRENKKQEEAA
jgi:hypothetical protein